ncbi:MAG: hypothetical protein ACREKL_10240 [Chthoniobacterales bacterium]
MRNAFLLLLLTATAFAADDYPGAPASVTAAYIEADGRGLALDGETAPLLLGYTTWKDAPGWDSFVVIKSYDIGEVGWTGDKASVQITYDVLGQIDGMKFTSKPANEEVFFELVKKKGKWKIVKPQLAPHLFVAGAITALEAIGAKDDATGKAALKKLKALEE